jgi:hypothetical protein
MSDGTRIELGAFAEDEEVTRTLGWLTLEASTAHSWIEFQNRTAHRMIERAKKRLGKEWSSDPVYRIQLDIVGQLGALHKELRGEIRPDFIRLVVWGIVQREPSLQATVPTQLLSMLETDLSDAKYRILPACREHLRAAIL